MGFPPGKGFESRSSSFRNRPGWTRFITRNWVSHWNGKRYATSSKVGGEIGMLQHIHHFISENNSEIRGKIHYQNLVQSHKQSGITKK